MKEATGFLQVFVRTAGESIPVAGADVLIEGDGVSLRLITDRSGKTARVPLPAPRVENSATAEGTDPFALYRVTTGKEGFYTQVTQNVPVFPGIGSLQPVTLIGVAEYGSLAPQSSTSTVVGDPQALHR